MAGYTLKTTSQVIDDEKKALKKKIYNKVFEGGKKPAAKKTTKKPAAKKPTYSHNYWDVKRSKNETDLHNRTYFANKKGVVRSTSHGLVHTRNVGGDRVVSLPSKYTSIDTTGYSKGKKEFTIKQKKTNPSDGMEGSKSYTSWTIPRSKVKSTLNTMKKGTGMLAKEAALKKKKKTTTKKK
jgi:hypothetical protein